MPFLSAYSIFANSNLFLYIKKDTQKNGCLFWRRRRDTLGSLLRSPTGTRTTNSPQDCSNAERLSFSNLFLYIKKDTQKMGAFFGAEGEIPSARFCARRQAPGQRTVHRTVLTLSVCPFRISFFTSKKTPEKWVSILAQKERFELSRRFPGLRP